MRLLRIWPDGTQFDFMRLRRFSFPFSALLSIVTVALFLTVGLDFGIDLLTLSPSISVSASARKLTTLIPRGQPRASSVLRSISRDVLNAPTMGEISDRFHRSRKIRKNSGFNPERPRMEPKQFERSKTHWKEPL